MKVTFYFLSSAHLSYRCRTPVFIERNCLRNRFEFPCHSSSHLSSSGVDGVHAVLFFLCVPTQWFDCQYLQIWKRVQMLMPKIGTRGPEYRVMHCLHHLATYVAYATVCDANCDPSLPAPVSKFVSFRWDDPPAMQLLPICVFVQFRLRPTAGLSVCLCPCSCLSSGCVSVIFYESNRLHG